MRLKMRSMPSCAMDYRMPISVFTLSLEPVLVCPIPKRGLRSNEQLKNKRYGQHMRERRSN